MNKRILLLEVTGMKYISPTMPGDSGICTGPGCSKVGTNPAKLELCFLDTQEPENRFFFISSVSS
jgi:hypothetical protein